MIDRSRLYFHTVRHLAPAQVLHRVRLRGQRVALRQWPDLFAKRWVRHVPPNPGWPKDFLPLDAQLDDAFPAPEANAEGVFRFIELERKLGSPPDWEQADAPQLWRYHLHYFDWAWSFARHPDRAWAREVFTNLWRSWKEGTTFGRWDAWSPYVASVRSWALCGAYEPLVRDTDHQTDFLADLALHAGFVRANLEHDVGGNHLIKNVKALIGMGVFLRDDDLVELGGRLLRDQIRIQVLPDGGHYERSPSYHCQVLSDLLDMRNLLVAYGRTLSGLENAIEWMRQWLGVMLMPDGDVPLFNDCWLVGLDRLRLLEPAPRASARLVVLEPSGYVVVRPSDSVHVVADIGPPCPDELPAHAHADCLSFELAVDGRRAIADTGTSTYEAGPRRHLERSTRAHNTLEIDGENQTEVWGAFRAARRARPTLELANEAPQLIEVRGSQDGYERLPGKPRHRRTWRVWHDRVEIVDDISGEGIHDIAVRFHVLDERSIEIRLPQDIDRVEQKAERAVGFNRIEECKVIEGRAQRALPATLTTVIQLQG